MFPTGIITRNIEVGPTFDLQSGAPFTIHVMVAPTRNVLWHDTGDAVVARLKTYIVPAGASKLIELPATDQEGFEDSDGHPIILDSNDHAFGYKISVFYLRNGSVVRKDPARVVTLPAVGQGTVYLDGLVSYSSGDAGTIVSTPDVWSAQIAAAQAAVAEAANTVTNLENTIDVALDNWFAENTGAVVSPATLDEALNTHREEPTPHTAYDLDIPSLTVLFENGLV